MYAWVSAISLLSSSLLLTLHTTSLISQCNPHTCTPHVTHHPSQPIHPSPLTHSHLQTLTHSHSHTHSHTTLTHNPHTLTSTHLFHHLLTSVRREVQDIEACVSDRKTETAGTTVRPLDDHLVDKRGRNRMTQTKMTCMQ